MSVARDTFDHSAYRAFLQRKREEVAQWPAWKHRAAEAGFAPRLSDEESAMLVRRSGLVESFGRRG